MAQNNTLDLSMARAEVLDFFASTPKNPDKMEVRKRKRIGSCTCPRCETLIDYAKDYYYPCSICSFDFCLKCTGMSKALHEVMQENTNGDLMWTCKTCRQNFPSLSNVSKSISNLDKKNDLRLDQLEKKLDDMNITVEQKVVHHVSNMKKEVVKEISSNILDNIKAEVRSEVREIDDQKSRVMNVLCFNMPESNNESSEGRRTDDLTNFLAVCEALEMKIEKADIKMAFRLGNRAPGTINRIRPLKVILENKRIKRELIDRAKQINMKAPRELKNVVIVKDLTPAQREINKTRRQARQTAAALARRQAQSDNSQQLTQNSGIRQRNSSQQGNLGEETLNISGMETQTTVIGGMPFYEETIVDNSVKEATGMESQTTVIGGIPFYEDTIVDNVVKEATGVSSGEPPGEGSTA